MHGRCDYDQDSLGCSVPTSNTCWQPNTVTWQHNNCIAATCKESWNILEHLQHCMSSGIVVFVLFFFLKMWKCANLSQWNHLSKYKSDSALQCIAFLAAKHRLHHHTPEMCPLFYLECVMNICLCQNVASGIFKRKLSVIKITSE